MKVEEGEQLQTSMLLRKLTSLVYVWFESWSFTPDEVRGHRMALGTQQRCSTSVQGGPLKAVRAALCLAQHAGAPVTQPVEPGRAIRCAR